MNYLNTYAEEIQETIEHIMGCYIDSEYFGYTLEEGQSQFKKDLKINDLTDTNEMFTKLLVHIKDQWNNEYYNYDFVNFKVLNLENSEDLQEFSENEEAVDTLVCAVLDMIQYELYSTEIQKDRTELVTYENLLEYIWK
jgi:hypothetical protein